MTVSSLNNPPSVPNDASQPPPTGNMQLDWSAPPGMIGLSIKNFLLRLITLGIYGFWGKTEVRRRIWSAARLNGEPLQYTGTGKELFLGFLIVFAVVVLPVILLSFAVGAAFGPKSTALQVFQVILYAAFFLLAGVATYRAQRYRLSRTSWRGIRGGMEGNSWSFAWTYFWTGLLIPLTLGWASPWRSAKLQSRLTDDMRFGSVPFRFTAGSGPLYSRFAILWFGGLLILGLLIGSWFALIPLLGVDPRQLQTGPTSASSIAALLLVIYGTLFVATLLYMFLSGWYRARMMNHFAEHTHFEDASFRGRATAGSLIWLGISNFLLVFLTLGLLTPIAQARSARYMVERLSIDGNALLESIAQRAEDAARRGEGLAQAFDIDAF